MDIRKARTAAILKKMPNFPVNIKSLWYKFLYAEPPSKRKENYIFYKAKTHSEIMGVLTDHLMSVARNVGVPTVYIRNLSRFRNHYDAKRSSILTKHDLRGKTNLLLEAVCEKIDRKSFLSVMENLKSN